jgi:hypothetical protein
MNPWGGPADSLRAAIPRNKFEHQPHAQLDGAESVEQAAL